MTALKQWYFKNGTQSNLIPSIRIRLARNLKQFPFEDRMTIDQQNQLSKLVQQALEQLQMGENKFRYLKLSDMSEKEIYSLLEKHLISLDLSRNTKTGFVAISEDDSISIMVNEEDHIRIQVLSTGFDLEHTLDLANKIDDYFDHELDYAFDPKLGFLTACPTNLGTGMRASVMVHLPALKQFNAIQQLSNNLGKLGMTIRGSFGEGTNVQGDMYTISNQVTLGISEQNAIQNLENIAKQIIEKEQNARNQLKDNDGFLDAIWRSYAILKYAKLISGEECSQLLSSVRLGVSMGILTDISLEQINEITAYYMPSSLCLYYKKDLDAHQRDAARAQMVQQILTK